MAGRTKRGLNFLRNRKPVSDEIVYVKSIPYSPLSGWVKSGEEQVCEAVDPWGNQVHLHRKSGNSREITAVPFMTKRSIRALRLFHPEIAEQLDTDRTSDWDLPGREEVSVGSRSGIAEAPLAFVKKEVWVYRNGSFVLDYEYGDVDGFDYAYARLRYGKSPVTKVSRSKYSYFARTQYDMRETREVWATTISMLDTGIPMEDFFGQVWSDPEKDLGNYEVEWSWLPDDGVYVVDDGDWTCRYVNGHWNLEYIGVHIGTFGNREEAADEIAYRHIRQKNGFR